MKSPDTNKKFIKILIIALEALAVGVIIYLVALPFYPLVKYRLLHGQQGNATSFTATSSLTKVPEKVKEETAAIKNHLPQAGYDVSPNRVIIPKIGVNAPIVESSNAEYGLSRGAWRIPESSTPNMGGNTVITGHRFKYLPPHNLTFYLFHKLEIGFINISNTINLK